MKKVLLIAFLALSSIFYAQIEISHQAYFTAGSLQSFSTQTISGESYDKYNAAFNVGIGYQGDIRISDRFDFRVMPLLNMSQASIGGDINSSLTLLTAELPLSFKLNIKKFYIHTGPSVSYDIIKQFAPTDLKRTNPLSFIAGLGFDLEGADIAFNVNGPYQFLSKDDVDTATQFFKLNLSVGIDL